MGTVGARISLLENGNLMESIIKAANRIRAISGEIGPLQKAIATIRAAVPDSNFAHDN